MMKSVYLTFILILLSVVASAQKVAIGKQLSFPKHVPAGNFSGITPLGGGLYAVVDDKKPDGFYIFQIEISPANGKILSVENKGFLASGLPNRDAEDIVYLPSSNTLFINGEAGSRVMEYRMDGVSTGRELSVPDIFKHPMPNRGIEALAYDSASRRFWITSECMLPADGDAFASMGEVLRFQSFDDVELQPAQQPLFYLMDPPRAKHTGRLHVKGVSAVTALPDGRLLVLERECYLPKRKVGAWVECRLYVVNPAEVGTLEMSVAGTTTFLAKKLLCKWRTRNFRFANYEGLCLGPVLNDGRQTLLLVSDSQNQYGSVLKDWFRVLILPSTLPSELSR